MRKAGGRSSEFKIGRWLFLSFIFFLLITTSNEQKSFIDETSQNDAESLINTSPEADRISYTPWVSHGEGKALSSQLLDPDIPYGNHGPFLVSPDATNRDALSIDNEEMINGYSHFFYKDITIDHNQVEGYFYYKDITIDHTKITADLTNFPVLIELYDADLQDNAQTDGDDILFRDASGTQLAHELEVYEPNHNVTHAHLVAWVRIPSLSASSNTVISMYYGNPTVGSQENLEGVWDDNYKGVWHLSEDPSDTAPQMLDSTANDNDGTSYGSMTSNDQVAGQIDGSLDFDGSNDYVSCGNDASLNIVNAITVEAWVQQSIPQPINWPDIVGQAGEWAIYHDGDREGYITFTVKTTGGQKYPGYYTLPVDTWIHVVGVYDGSNAMIYIDGNLETSQPLTGTIVQTSADLRFARDGGTSSDYFEGLVDEVRVSDIVRSADWIATEYNNQNDPASFYSVDNEQEVVLTNFPVLIDLYDADLQDDAQADGDDILFRDSSGTQLAHEIEVYEPNYNGTHAHLVAWVRTNLSTSSDTILSMYYGYPTVGNQENPEGVWNDNYKGVWHLGETTGGAGAIKDLTSNNNDGTDSGNPTFGAIGQIGYAIDFDGFDDYVNVTDSTSLDITDEITIEAWGKDPIVVYYFNGYDISETWPYDPQNMVDGNEFSRAHSDWNNPQINVTQLCNSNTAPGTDLGVITKVEMRARIDVYGSDGYLYITPVFSAGNGSTRLFQNVYTSWTSWFDITSDPNAPGPWTWSDVQNLNVRVMASDPASHDTSVYKIEIRVTHAYKTILSKGDDAYALKISKSGSTLNGYINNNEITSNVLSPTNWHYYVMTYNGFNQILYIDGSQANSTSLNGPIPNNDNDLTIGIQFTGTIDEVRISNVARLSEWIATEYNNLNDPTSFYSVGSEQEVGSVAPYEDYDLIGFDGGSILRGGMAYSLDVPRGARIEEAYLSLHAVDASGSAQQVQIYVYDVPSVPVFGYHRHLNGLLEHAQTWATPVLWTPPAVASWNGWISTPSLVQLVQHIIDRSDWQPGNYIGFIINGSDSGNWWRAWHHYGNLPGFAPKLTVRYTYPGWWNANYGQRVPINITNNADIALPTGYSVSFSINTWYLNQSGLLQPDGDDLRISYFNSSTGLWTELTRVNTTSFNTYKTQIWFQTQASIPSNSYDPNYYMYYDNPSAVNPPQNPANVFLFFDDFDDGNINGWSVDQYSGASWWAEVYPTGSGNYITRGNNPNAYLYKTTGTYGDVAISALIRFPSEEIWHQRGVSVRYYEGWLGDPTSNPASYLLRMNAYENLTQFLRRPDYLTLNATMTFPGTAIEPFDLPSNYQIGNWYRYEVAAQTVNTDDVFVRGRIYDANMTLRTELTYLDTTSKAIYEAGKIALFGGYGMFDDVIVRKFINPEPTVSLDSRLGIQLMLICQDSTYPPYADSPNYIMPYYDHLVKDLGYIVDFHGHENKQTMYSPWYVEDYDAALIAPQVNSDWTKDLLDKEIPVISWEEDTYNELYLGSGKKRDPTLYRTYIVNNTHYITLGLPNDTAVTIYSTNSSMSIMTDYTQLPSESDIVLLSIRINNTDHTFLVDGQLLAVEKGGVDYFPPHTAPERRVHWPGQDGNALTSDGWTLFDRAFNWTLYVDQQPPVIHEYGHIYYGNGTAMFYANVTDALESVSSVYLNYKVDGISQTPVNLQWNGSHWVWSNTFAFNKEIRYTILNATDSRGNVNSSLIYVWDLPHSFVTVEEEPPTIQAGGYENLSSTDGLLRFWFNATDEGLGIDPFSGSINITSQDYPTGIVYPMPYNGTHFTADVGLRYWVGGIPEGTQQTFNYTYTVLDLSGLSTTSGGVTNQMVPDIVPPSLGEYGVQYNDVTDMATIWSLAYDGVNGSGIDTSPANDVGVNVSYFITRLPNTTFSVRMQWNTSHFIYTIPQSIGDNDWFYYYFNATDRTGNFKHSFDNPGYFDPQDSLEPVIVAYGSEYYGNGTAWFWANVTDNTPTGYNASRVERVDLRFNSTVNPIPQTAIMTRYNESFWEWRYTFAWNQLQSPYAVNYTIARAKDGSGNENTTLANVWSPQHSFMTEDWFPPVVDASGFDALADYDGHLRFWVDLSDYSGIDSNKVFLNLTLSSGQPNYQMSHNGTFYTVEIGLPYWDPNNPTQRTAFDYTFTSSDLVQQSTTAGGAAGENVPDIVAPSISAYGVVSYPAGQAIIWILAMDEINGSGVDPNEVYVDYSIVGVGGPWTYPMPFNGTHWTYVNSSLAHGDEIAYSVNVTDQAGNNFLSTSWTKFYFDTFPPTIVDYNYTQDGAGNLEFWAQVTDDQSLVSSVRYQFWLSSLGFQNKSRTMTNNGTHWVSDPLSFPWNTTGSFTIPQTMDSRGNVNTSLDGVWAKNFIATDWGPPTISAFGYTNLTDRDGHLEFWVEPDDTYSGIDPNNVYLNLTLSGSSPQLYPMTLETGNHYAIERDLPYWQVIGSTRTQFDYNFVIYDQAGNSYSGGGQSNRDVPDIVAPVVSNPGGHGGDYNAGTGNVTMWSTAYDGNNGSGLQVAPAGVYLNYSAYDVDGPYSDWVQMQWNGSHWVYMVNETFSQGQIVYFYINATDYEGNNATGGMWWYTVQDGEEPKIPMRGVTDNGNGTVTFYANVTDASPIQYVELNYTYGGVPYLQNMTYNGTYYMYTPSYIPWNTDVDYTIARAADIANNINYTLATDFLTLTTVDLEAPVISTTGFEPLPDKDGHLRFWANISDSYSGLNPSSISINITLSSGVSGTYLMTNNGTFYTYETNIAYWEIPYTDRMAVTYNVTAFDNAGNPASLSGGPATYVTEVVPPELDDYAGIEEVGSSARFWCTPQDGINGSQVRAAAGASVFLYYYNTSPPYKGPYTMSDDGTRWTWLNLTVTFTPGEIIYFYVSATDGAGNSIDNAGAPWTHMFGDAVPPTIVSYGFNNLADEDGHLHFWADVTDIGTIKNVTLDLFIIDTSTALSIGMPWNGSYYTASPYLTCGHTFNYNITAYDTALLTDMEGDTGQSVQDVVAPKILDLSVIDHLNGTVTIWVETLDGVNGTGFPPANDSIVLSFYKNGFGPFQRQMAWNGSDNFYTYSITNLHSGDILDYYITVEDVALNSWTSSMRKCGVADKTPPSIHGSGHEFVPDVDGHIQFWVSVSEDIGVIPPNGIIIEGEVSDNPPTLFSYTMTSVNDTYYIYDMYAAFGKTISYNITVWNVAGLSNQTPLVIDQVKDVVAPQNQNFRIVQETDNQDRTVNFRVSVTDGSRGSGINPSNVYFIYRFGGSGWQTKKMVRDGTSYVSTVSGVFVGDVIEYYVQATDNAGNTGEGPRRVFAVSDRTAPHIDKMGFEYLNDSDGHIRFWCNAYDPFGTIGRATIKITGDQEMNEPMIWMGEYFYYDTNLTYGNVFNFAITVRDTAGNEASQNESGHTVQDTVPPRILEADGEEFQNGTAILWTMVEDGTFGSGFPSARNTVNITYQLNAGFPKTFQMVWNPSANRYEQVVNDLSVGDVFAFFIQATDKVGNSNTETIIAYTFAVPDSTPPQIHACGYSLMPADDGLVQFWVNASDPFGNIENVQLIIAINETSTSTKSANTSPSNPKSSVLLLERAMQFNGTHYIHEENIGYQAVFSYTIIVIDGAELQSKSEDASRHIVGDGAPPRINNADIIDPGNGKLTIWAEVEEEGTGVDSLEVVYSVDEGQNWYRIPMMKFNSTHYFAPIEIEAGGEVLWTIATKDLGGNTADNAWKVWLKTPYKTQKGFNLIYLVGIITAAVATAGIAIKKFRKVVGLDKERVMRIANQMSDEEVIARLDDHTFGVVLSFFDQREGPIPAIVIPSLLEDHIQFLIDLSDRSFSAGGFVEETTEEKITIFELGLEETRMVCTSYAFAIDNPEARGGKENMTINLLVDPVYGELTNIFSPEILPSVRWIRSLIENKTPRESVATQMEGLRFLVTRIIASYQEIYGEEAIIDVNGEVLVEEI